MPARRRSPSRKPPRKELLTIGYSAQWDAATEQASMHTCAKCGGDLGPIQPGSAAVCLACTRTGREEELAYDRTLALRARVAQVARFRPKTKAEPAPA